MKNSSSIVQAIMAVAIAVLFYLYTTVSVSTSPAQEETDNTAEDTPTEQVTSGSQTIAYINFDTLNKKYEMLKDMQESLIEEKTKLENNWRQRATSLENKVIDFQKRAQAGTLSQLDIEAEQASLQREQNELLQKKDDYALQLQDQEAKMFKEMQQALGKFLDGYNKDGKFKLILGYQPEVNLIMWVDSTMDITDEVVVGLNEAYAAQQQTSAP